MLRILQGMAISVQEDHRSVQEDHRSVKEDRRSVTNAPCKVVLGHEHAHCAKVLGEAAVDAHSRGSGNSAAQSHTRRKREERECVRQVVRTGSAGYGPGARTGAC
jgi:hypothetical protein